MMAGASAASGPMVESRAQRAQKLDWYLILATLILLVVGFMSLYSVDAGAGGGRYFVKQFIRLGIGIVPFIFFYWVTPKTLIRFSALLYAVNVGLLLMVLKFGSSSGGAQRWISFHGLEFQPSEMSKILTVVTLAAFLAQKQPEDLRKFSTYLASLLIVGLPMLLIFKQPHLGASLTILVAWLGVTLCAGLRMRFLVGTLLSAVLMIGLALTVPGVLKSYQLERLYAMFGGDSKGNKFQTMQAKSAFASGSLTGVGFLKGEQKRAGFVPEQPTDFIFTVIGEEGGLVGCTLVLAAFGFFFYRIWLIMFRAQDPFHKMLAAGIFSYLAFHTVVNIGMNLELLPVVGLWLPFMSFGGTAIWLCLASVGLLLNIHSRERPVLF